MWLFELSQNPTEQHASVVPVIELQTGELEPKIICSGPAEPQFISITAGRILMNISNCILPPHEKIEIRIVGKTPITFEASYDSRTQRVHCDFRWYQVEPAAVFVVLDDVTLPGHFTTHFVDPSNKNDAKMIGVEVNDDFTVITLNFSECGYDQTNFSATYVYKESGYFLRLCVS